MLYQMIIFASGINFTMKPYVSHTQYNNYTKKPQCFTYQRYHRFQQPYNFSSPLLIYYEYPNIIYCFNLKKVTVAETDMWTKYVPKDIWGLVGLCCLLFAILNPISSSPKIRFKFILQNVFLVIDSFLNLIGIFLRQSWPYKWKLLGILELVFSILICVYENSITVNVVQPLIPKPFTSTVELYNNNYTFVVQTLNFLRAREWLAQEYNRTNHPKVFEVKHFQSLREWLERYFLNHQNDIKYAIVGYLMKGFHYPAVKFVKDKNDTCYQMFPTEKAFSPQPFYFRFASAVASSLKKGVSRIQAAGFMQVLKASEDFRINLLALAVARPMASKYENELTYKDLDDIKLQRN